MHSNNRLIRILLGIGYILSHGTICWNVELPRHELPQKAHIVLSHTMIQDSSYIEVDPLNNIDTDRIVFLLNMNNVIYDTIYVVSNAKLFGKIEALFPSEIEVYENGVSKEVAFPYYAKGTTHKMAKGDSLAILLVVTDTFRLSTNKRYLNHYHFYIDSSGYKNQFLDIGVWSDSFSRYPKFSVIYDTIKAQ